MTSRRHVGVLPLSFDDVPLRLWDAMRHDLAVLHTERLGGPTFTNVQRQGGKVSYRSRSFAVQLWNRELKRIARIALVRDERVGAVLAIAALADPNLRAQTACHAWMKTVCADPVALDEWLAHTRLGTLVRHGTRVYFPHTLKPPAAEDTLPPALPYDPPAVP